MRIAPPVRSSRRVRKVPSLQEVDGGDDRQHVRADIDPTLGQRLKRWRVFLKIKQGPAAKAIGHSQGWLSHVETGKSVLVPEVLPKLARFYNVPAWDLVSREPYEPTDEDKAFRLIREFDHRMIKLAIQMLTVLALAANR